MKRQRGRSLRSAWLLFRLLNIPALRSHPLRTLLSITGVTLGVSLILAVLVLNGSLTGSYSASAVATGAGADVEITTPAVAGLDQEAFGRVTRLPDVRLAAPVLDQSVILKGPRGDVQALTLAVDDRFQQVAGTITNQVHVRRIRAGPGVLLGSNLAETLGVEHGGNVRFIAGGPPTDVPVIGTLNGDVVEDVLGGRIAVLPLALGQRILGHAGRLTSIYVEGRDHSGLAVDRLVASIRHALPSADVHPTSQGIAQLQRSTSALAAGSAFFSALVLIVGAYLVSNVMSIAVAERRRESAILLSLGENPRVVILRFVCEAMIAGVAGTAIGEVIGSVLGRGLVASFPTGVQDAYGFVAKPTVPLVSYVVAASAGLLSSIVASLVPALSIRHVPPVEALRPDVVGDADGQGVPRLRALLGCFVVGAALVVALRAPEHADVAGLALVVGVVLASSFVVVRILSFLVRPLAGWRLRRGAGVIRIAAANVRAGPRRAVGAVMAVAVSLGLVVAIGGTSLGLGQSSDHYATGFVGGVDLFVSDSRDDYLAVPMDPSLTHKVAAAPGVAQVTELRDRFISWRGRRVLLVGNDPRRLAGLDIDYYGGSASFAASRLDGGGAVISTQIEQLDGVKIGENLQLETPMGRHTFKVTAVVGNWAWPDGVIIIGGHIFAGEYAQPQPNELEVVLTRGARLESVRQRISHEIGTTGLRIEDAAQLRSRIASEQSALLAPFDRMRDIVVMAGVLAILNIMLIAVLWRRREIGVLRAIGLGRRGVEAAVLVESLVLVTAGLCLGAVLGELLDVFGVAYLRSQGGLPIRWSIETEPLIVGAIAGLAMAIAGASWPASRAGRTPVLEAIAYE